ncbi:polymer-forming cytoskeletal protein [Vibrio anguillarum]|nr:MULTISPECIES: polymer-forming cytoskeletal protein [Vibrio]
MSGELRLESDIQIDGSVEGQLHVDKTIVISETGTVNGELYAGHIIINGEFQGTCHATKIEILSKGSVTGSIYSDDLSIEQGGRFNGVTYPAPEKQVVELKEAKIAAEG